MTSAALYRTRVDHTRLSPIRYRLRHRGYQWLVDLADLPRPVWPLRWLARFRAADHLGDPDVSIRENVVAFCASHGLDLRDGRITMLANARAWGYVFNPLTVYWCRDREDVLRCVVAEVHNTYGGRHAYLLRVDEAGRAATAKEFYVSPFLPVDGHYRLSLPEPGDRLRLAVTVVREDRPVLVASVNGRRRPADTANLLGLALRHPFATLAVSAAIRWHGIRLYLRRLPVVPRPDRRSSTPVDRSRVR